MEYFSDKVCNKHNTNYTFVGFIDQNKKTPRFRCKLCRQESVRASKLKRYISPQCPEATLNNMFSNANRDFVLYGFDFKYNSVVKDEISIGFIKNNYISCKCIEDFMARWYESKGAYVDRLYLRKKGLNVVGSADLLVEINGLKRFVEIKSPNDVLKFSQFLFLQKNCGILVWINSLDDFLIKKSNVDML